MVVEDKDELIEEEIKEEIKIGVGLLLDSEIRIDDDEETTATLLEGEKMIFVFGGVAIDVGGLLLLLLLVVITLEITSEMAKLAETEASLVLEAINTSAAVTGLLFVGLAKEVVPTADSVDVERTLNAMLTNEVGRFPKFRWVGTNTGGTFLVIVIVLVCGGSGGGAFGVFGFRLAPTSGMQNRQNIQKT